MDATHIKPQDQLVESSIEAYINALETINRLSMTYRVETFTYLICCAWEKLLKAHMLQENISIEGKQDPTYTVSITTCINRIFPESDPVRRNFEKVNGLRNDATHFVFTLVPKEILSLFQVCVVNYHHHLQRWFGISLSDRVSVGMMTIAYDFDPKIMDWDDATISTKLDQETLEYLARKQKEIREEWEALGKPAEYAFDFNYTVAIVKKEADGMISLVNDISGVSIGVVHVPKDAADTHPYRLKELLQDVNARLMIMPIISNYDILCVNAVYNIARQQQFYFKSNHPGQQSPFYSLSFADWIVDKYLKDNAFFRRTRDEFRKLQKQEKSAAKRQRYEEMADVQVQDFRQTVSQRAKP